MNYQNIDVETIDAEVEALEHEATVKQAMKRARSNWTLFWQTDADAIRRAGLTEDDYKRVCIAALEGVREQYGVITTKGSFEAIGISAAHHVTKHIFEENPLFNPLEDQDFIDTILPLCPHYVARYLDKFTLDQFATAFAKE